MTELNDKQKRFCEEYVKDLNAKQAAIRCGYSEKTAEQQASRLLRHVKVQQEVERLKTKVSKRVELDAAWVLKKLKKVLKRCLQEEEIKDKHGAGTGVFKFEHAGANKSLELIGRYFGMYSDNVRLADPNGKPLAPITINMTQQEASIAYLEKIKSA